MPLPLWAPVLRWLSCGVSCLVRVVTGGGGRDQYGVLGTLLSSYIDPAVESDTSLPANPDGAALLESRIQQAAAQPDARPVPSLSETARRVSGRTYATEANPLGLTHVSLTFQDEKAALLRLVFGETYQFEIHGGDDTENHGGRSKKRNA